MRVAAQIFRVLKGALSRGRVVPVRLTPDVEATIYDRPGEWMSDVELERLRSEIRFVASGAIPGALSYGVFLPTRAPYANRIIVIGRHLRHGEAVGFNAMPILDVKLPDRTVTVLHLGLLVIHPKYQRQGFQGLLYGLGGFSALHRITHRPVWVSNVTEVPAVFGAVAEQFLDVYPSHLRSDAPPAEHLALAEAIMRDHRHEFGVGPEAGFDPERFVIQGSYTGGSDALKKTFDSAPKHRDPLANDFCRRELDYERGDDFLQILQMDTPVYTNWLTRRVPAPLQPAAARQMRLWTYPSSTGR